MENINEENVSGFKAFGLDVDFQKWDTYFTDPKFFLKRKPDPYFKRIVCDIRTRGIKRLASIPCGDFVNERVLLDNGFVVDGYDTSRAALGRAKILSLDSKLSVHDALTAPLPARYDSILANDFFMHLNDSDALHFLNNLERSVVNYGVVYTNFLSPDDDTAKNYKLDSENVARVDKNIIIKYRSLGGFEELISKTSFRIKEIEKYERLDEPHHGFHKDQRRHTHRGYFAILQKDYTELPEVLDSIKKGAPIIVLDHRELEGDFFVASEKITPEVINYFLTNGRGVLCVSMLPDRANYFGVRMSQEKIGNIEDTPFGRPIDYIIGTTTGVSAHDRAATIRAVADQNVLSEQFSINGHVRTLIAQSELLSKRQGHTEASVQLALLAGFYPSGAIIEILKPDGTMAREDYLLELSKKYNIAIIKVDQLIRYLDQS